MPYAWPARNKQKMPASHFHEFCQNFVELFDNQFNEEQSWRRVASLLVEEVSRPATLGFYMGDDAFEQLRISMEPILMQEGLIGAGVAFFGGMYGSHTELLLEQVELFLEDPDDYEMPEIPALQNDEEDPNN